MSSDSKTHIKVCHGRACSGQFSKYILERAQTEAAGREDILCEECPCQDNCKKGPTVMVNDQKHSHMDPVKIAKLIKSL